jgi:CHAT domain-containing protein/tetratricopeptide (TPR) repeat protein
LLPTSRPSLAKAGRILVCILLVAPLPGSFAARKTTPANPAEAASVSAALRPGDELFRAGHYQQAAAFFQSALDGPQNTPLKTLPARALGNLGACQFALHRYQSALRFFSEAHRRAESAGDLPATAVLNANIASVYVQMGEYPAAAAWVERSIASLSGPDRALHLPRLQLQLATLRARQGRMDESFELFRRGIDGADRAADTSLFALGWNRLGEEYLQRGELAPAEHALLEAYRIRKLNHLPLDSSYRNLGRLRLAQGDLRSAETLLNRAVECSGRPDGLVPSWQVYHTRGRIRLTQGRLSEALDDFRVALRLARAWRGATPADDTSRIGAEATLDQLYSSLIETGNRLYLQNHDPALPRETFVAAEENRAASLRALLNRPNSQDQPLPPSYWEALSRLQRAEIAALRQPGSGAIEAARADLVRMETALGPDLHPLPVGFVDRLQRTLDFQTVLLSFHLGPSHSWLWVLDRNGFVLYVLPPQETIRLQAQAVRSAIAGDLPTAAERSADLYRTLFIRLAPRFRNASVWLLALDQSLFDTPIAALVETRHPHTVYLAEHHVLQVIPSAAYWLESAALAPSPLSPLFVGVGDAIYNRADERATGLPRAAAALTLPRLAGSSAEIAACARAWNGPSLLLQGRAASAQNISASLERRPAVVHLAAHFLESAAQPRYSLLALTLTPAGEPQLLTPFEIARWRVHAGLVVLSGCHSAAGVPLPATGLQGLTRAWLAAGAQAVLGTLWETPDDDGAMFRSFYQTLRRGSRLDGARALHAAQLDMIRSRGRCANPHYWSAYFLVGGPGKTLVTQWK